MTAIKQIIGDCTKPLETFDEGLFDAIVDKVVVIGRGEFEFWFENGAMVRVEVGK